MIKGGDGGDGDGRPRRRRLEAAAGKGGEGGGGDGRQRRRRLEAAVGKGGRRRRRRRKAERFEAGVGNPYFIILLARGLRPHFKLGTSPLVK